MKKNPEVFIGHMLESIALIEQYVGNRSFTELEQDRALLDAVVRRFEIIGEAAKNLEDTFRRAHADIPWHDVIDFRNVLIHEYFDIDTEVLWTIVVDELPVLKKQLEALQPSLAH